MKITDEAVEAGLENYAEGGCMGLAEYERREVVVDILEAALPHLSQGAVRDATYTEMLIDNAATASQNATLMDDPVTREALRLNIIDPLLALASHEPAPADIDKLGAALDTQIDVAERSAKEWRDRATSITTDTQEGVGEVVAYAEVLSGKIATVRIDKSRHCTEPLVRQSALTACQQEVGRLRDILAKTEQEFEAIRYGLINHLNGPERSLFWKAVSARDRIRAVLGGQSNEA